VYNPITEIKEEKLAAVRAEGLAKGRAEGMAQASRAIVASLISLLELGVLTRDMTRIQLQDLIQAGAITREIGQDALSRIT
jgi:hypothetical protein